MIHPKVPVKLGARMVSFLSFSAPAVLTAIWVPIIFIQDKQLNISTTNPYLISATVAVFLAYRFKNVYLTLLLSGGLFILLKVFFAV